LILLLYIIDMRKEVLEKLLLLLA